MRTLMAKTVNGNPAFVYVEAGGLYYIRALDVDGNSWPPSATLLDFTTVTGAGNLQGIGIQIINGNPALSYQIRTGTNTKLKFVRAADNNGTSWNDRSISGTLRAARQKSGS